MVTAAHGGCVNKGPFSGTYRPFAAQATTTANKLREILEKDGRLTSNFSKGEIEQLKRFFNPKAVKHYAATKGVIAKTHSPKDEAWLVPGYLKAVELLFLPEIIRMDDRRPIMGLMAFFEEMKKLSWAETVGQRAREHRGDCGTLEHSRRKRFR
jgi:hypothetical protein